MKFFICYSPSTLGTDDEYIILTSRESVKDRFLNEAFICDIDDATFKEVEL